MQLEGITAALLTVALSVKSQCQFCNTFILHPLSCLLSDPLLKTAAKRGNKGVSKKTQARALGGGQGGGGEVGLPGSTANGDV